MARRKKLSDEVTPLELQILQVLWSQGPSNVLHVQKSLPRESDLAYTTVQTMLNVLHRKGRVRRTLRGRAYEYQAVVSQEAVTGHAVRDLIQRMFGGSPESLVMSLIKSSQVDPQRVAELSRMLATESPAVPPANDDKEEQ